MRSFFGCFMGMPSTGITTAFFLFFVVASYSDILFSFFIQTSLKKTSSYITFLLPSFYQKPLRNVRKNQHLQIPARIERFTWKSGHRFSNIIDFMHIGGRLLFVIDDFLKRSYIAYFWDKLFYRAFLITWIKSYSKYKYDQKVMARVR